LNCRHRLYRKATIITSRIIPKSTARQIVNVVESYDLGLKKLTGSEVLCAHNTGRNDIIQSPAMMSIEDVPSLSVLLSPRIPEKQKATFISYKTTYMT